MIPASEEFIAELNNNNACVNYADITLVDGTVLHLEPKDFMTTGNSITDKTSNGSFGIGKAIGKNCNITIANHKEQFSGYDFDNSVFDLYVAKKLSSGRIEKILKGRFHTVQSKTTGDVITIGGVDSMTKFDKEYAPTIPYPATLRNIALDACQICGVRCDDLQFYNMYMVVDKQPTSGTFRQVLIWIAEICGGFFKMSPKDVLEFVFYEEIHPKNIVDGGNTYDRTNPLTIDGGDFEEYEAEEIIDGGDFFTYTDSDNFMHIRNAKNLSVSTDDIKITGIIIDSYIVGTDEYALKISKNPFITDNNREKIAQDLFDKLKSYVIRPLSVETINNPLIEPYDIAYVHDRKGNEYLTCFNSVNYSTNGYTRIECLADSPGKIEKEYYSAMADGSYTREEVDDMVSGFATEDFVMDFVMDEVAEQVDLMETPTGFNVLSVARLPAQRQPDTIYLVRGGIIML